MLSYYRKSIIKLVSNLRLLEQDTGNLELLVEIQEEVSKKITYIESRIGQLKEKASNFKKDLRQKRLPKEKSSELKEKRRTIEERVKEYQWLLFVFRTVGDGVAFLYLDKWDIKPLAYKSDSPDYKETPGNIGGKTGIKGEKLMVSIGAAQGVAVLRTDLTNSIRYGDVCFLDGPTPRLIEVKSSNNTNARVSRQIEELKKVQAYLDDDYAFDLRGFPLVNRVDASTPEVTYIKSLNELIDQALQNRYAYREVETGVFYYVQTAGTEPRFTEFADKVRKPLFFYLNTVKNNSDWITYYPFTLSIENPENVYLFLEGEIQIMIFVDILTIGSIAEEKGYETNFINEPGWIVEFKEANGTGTFKISRHYLGRVALEFSSLRWLLSQILDGLQQRI
ncbi:MAG: hypothetical protein KDJ52_15790 [Anaerolineae bacterium]|nr:hypothetical protein [Anaerolineae bacterium]